MSKQSKLYTKSRDLRLHSENDSSTPQSEAVTEALLPITAREGGTSLSIRELPEAERPREKLYRLGPRALSTWELLAILLGSGARGSSALELAQLLLCRLGDLNSLSCAEIEELSSLRGVGRAKAARLVAAFELGRRVTMSGREAGMPVRCPADLAAAVMEEMRSLDREHFRIAMLDTRHRLIELRTVSVGTLDASLVHPRELFRDTIRRSSAAVILLHNHPSGDPTPSAEDLALTRRLEQAGRLLGIEVLDHLIIGDNRFVSFKESGLISHDT